MPAARRRPRAAAAPAPMPAARRRRGRRAYAEKPRSAATAPVADSGRAATIPLRASWNSHAKFVRRTVLNLYFSEVVPPEMGGDAV